MLGLAILVAVGGYMTIGFAYWALRQAVPTAAKNAANVAAAHLENAAGLVEVTSQRVQDAAAAPAADPAAVASAAQAHQQAARSLSEATGSVKELLAGLGSVFQSLGSLSPPVAALCVAVLMFLTAGGIEVANRLIH